jgi:hypothetical protein
MLWPKKHCETGMKVVALGCEPSCDSEVLATLSPVAGRSPKFGKLLLPDASSGSSASVLAFQEGCPVLVGPNRLTLSRPSRSRWTGSHLVLDWNTCRVRCASGPEVTPHLYMFSKVKRAHRARGVNSLRFLQRVALDALRTGAGESFRTWRQPRVQLAPIIY